MGRFDSSRSRVAPVFDRLRAIDPTGRSWLPTLLSLPAREARATVVPSSRVLKKARWWPEEERLPAPKELLRWLVHNAAAPLADAAWGTEPTKQKRISLTQRDPKVIAEAMKLYSRAHHLVSRTIKDPVAQSTEDWRAPGIAIELRCTVLETVQQ